VILIPLPIDPYIPAILARVRGDRALVVTAAPGAGKTTRIPPALASDGRVLLLQPRRIAARSLARRIADEQGWTLGREVGWHVRFERRFRDETRLIVATEGILTARLQQDSLLSAFQTIVIDEFHERTIHAELGIAFAKQAWLARADLRLVVMSATMDTAAVSAYLGGCTIVDVPGRSHPLTVTYRPSSTIAEAARDSAAHHEGDVLCFLPGAPEIRRAIGDVAAAAGPSIEILPLHGSLDAFEQDRALNPSGKRRIILATNIAETSLTVPRVSAVVDTGLQKTARYDPDRAIDSLETERVSLDAADQRAGRAARLGPGHAIRLWSEQDRLRPHREPDVARIDLSGPLLDVLAWGGEPSAFDWFEAPEPERVAAGLDLLRRLGALDGTRLTPVGSRMQSLPLHPRLARILIEGGGVAEVALACALLSERSAVVGCDIAAALDRPDRLPPHVRAVADGVRSVFFNNEGRVEKYRSDPGRALLAGYPDRVGKRRTPGSPRVLLASGHGAVLEQDPFPLDVEYLVALDVQAGRRGDLSEARIRLAGAVDRSWLTAEATRVEHAVDAAGRVRAIERDYAGAIVLAERPGPVDPDRAAALVAAAYLDRGLTADDERLLRRMRFAGMDPDPRALVEQAAYGRRALDEVDVAAALPHVTRDSLSRLAPESIVAPSGRRHTLEYEDDATVSASIKLQELFGLGDTPLIGSRRVPLLLKLLAPNGRPVQTTRDLRSFWTNTYPEVRKELRGRYPKHPWPDDPWNATPTARTRRS
jgi:ATP-dependent helicase HrpB